MQEASFENICQFLTDGAADFRTVHHEPTFTSEESARARGEELSLGGKALLLKTQSDFKLFVLSASLKVDSAAVKAHVGVRKTRFATPDELKELTGLVPGAVPPFGPPILPFKLYADVSLTRNDRIAFNAGSRTDSIILSMKDYLRLAQPEIFEFGG